MILLLWEKIRLNMREEIIIYKQMANIRIHVANGALNIIPVEIHEGCARYCYLFLKS